ncbi:hypothetical protein [Nonomuraea typhae]|uniref:hypothetical protein n=1 Tax=Nonomuraea typhae TaxID=2603600 RepID=UPI0012FB5220|nr:hypothetical protein [Nonomuraea typhae]
MLTFAALGCTLPATAAFAASPGRPPALPQTGAGPATFAYLCVTGKSLRPSGTCDTWRVVTGDGKIYSFPEALAYEKDKKDPDVGDTGSFAISPDGMRVAYHRASDDRVVVRDLDSAETWTVPYKVPRGSTGSPFTLRFVRDGNGLAITPADAEKAATVYVRVEEGTARRMPRGWTLLDADGDRFTLLREPGIGARGMFRTITGGKPADVKIPENAGKHLIWGPFAARDGRAANLVPTDPPACGPDMTPVWLTSFSTAAGTMKKVKPQLPKDVHQADVIDWLNSTEVVAAAGRERPGKRFTVPGSYVYAVDVTTGAARLLAKLSTRESIHESNLVVGGYLAARGAAADKAVKPAKGGCG